MEELCNDDLRKFVDSLLFLSDPAIRYASQVGRGKQARKKHGARGRWMLAPVLVTTDDQKQARARQGGPGVRSRGSQGQRLSWIKKGTVHLLLRINASFR